MLGTHARTHNKPKGLHRAGPSILEAQQDAAIRAAALEEARAALREPGAGGDDDACRTEPNAEYAGEFVVRWGEDHIKQSAADCCAACGNYARCNAWVWCGARGGCGGGRKFGECWLKEQKNLDPLAVAGARGPGGCFQGAGTQGAAILAHHPVAPCALL